MNRTEILADGITLHLGDCKDILPSLDGMKATIITDPPYGIAYKCGVENNGQGGRPGNILYDKVRGDDQQFDPEFLLAFQKVILWGANNFCEKLPPGGWIVWDKRLSETKDKMIGSPFELAWSSHRRLFKMIRVLHGGAINADAPNGQVANEPRFHPTQKPIRVMESCISFFPDDSTIVDPFMGSGTTGIAAVKTGRKFIGVEIEEKYFDIACRRISEASKQTDLFIEKPKSIQLRLDDH